MRFLSFQIPLAALVVALTIPSAIAQVRIEAEAFAGTPFGVGRVTIHSGGDFRVNLPPRPGRGRLGNLARRVVEQVGGVQGNTTELQSAELALVEKSARTHYPVFAKRDRPVLKQFINVPSESTVYFLFRGNEPLELTVYAPQPASGQVVPRNDREGFDRLLAAWWNDYSSAAEGRDADREYPQMVEEYLAGTLSRRLKLALPPRTQQRDQSILRGELALLAGTETARLEMAERVLAGSLSAEVANLPFPEELPAPVPEELTPPPDAPIEPLAMRVPVECLYVRFGNFPNFLWMQHRLEDWGGELRDVISERGLDYGLNDRIQRQLGLRQGKLAEVLGDKVIADVALIGTDTFVAEGAAIGTLFQAKSNLALSNDLMQQRRAAMRETKGGKEEKLTIAGRNVSFVHSPDGRLRSYYVADGDFHLVTTSRQIVEWFLAVADKQHPSLGESVEFRYTRARMPLDRNDTVFVYLSPQFFDNLLGPHYHIEMQRRLRSDVELELLPIAELAARGEGKSGGSIEELVAADMLPQGFGMRGDGSRLVQVEGQYVDSARGPRGAFLPIPDVTIDKVTPQEAEEYQQFKDYYLNEWGAMDPVVVGIRREELPEGKLERVVLDVQAAPLSKRHVEMLSNWLGEPTTARLAPVPGDVVSFQAVLRGGTFFSGGEHNLFGGLRNADPAIAMSPNSGLIAQILNSKLQGLQGYVGAWPQPGFLGLLTIAGDAPPDANGYTRFLTGLWRRQLGDFTLMSFHPEILEQVSPQLQFVEAARPAQVWLHADDLANSTLAPLINAFGYSRSRKIAAGNAGFMNMLVEQLHVPPAEAMQTGERILVAKFVAPLGGTYELRKWDGGLQNWVATAVADQPDAKQPPPDYQFRALRWLRGMDLELALYKGPQPALSAHGEFIMPVEAREATFQLPKLPFGTTPPKAVKPVEPKKPPTPDPPKPRPSTKREF